MGQGGRPDLTAIDPKGVARHPVPYYVEVEPPLAVAAGATAVTRYTFGPRDFICTGFGFTSQAVGVPAAGMYFKIGIRDIGASISFQPHRWHVTPVVGTNPAVGDQRAVEFPEKAPWTFTSQTTVEVEFENIGALACVPTLVLTGYLE